jgi:HK97 family phage prohead protease
MIKKLNCIRLKRISEKTADKAADDSAQIVLSYIASTDQVDRYGDVVDQQGWDLTGFKANPVILFNHHQDSLPIGKAKNIEVRDNRLEIDIEFDMSDDYSAKIARKAKGGFLNAVSVGFAPIEFSARGDLPRDHKAFEEKSTGNYYHRSELLEVSLVTVPANAGAIETPHAAKQFGFNDLETVFKTKKAEIAKHILAVEEREESWLVEFAKVIIEEQVEEEEEIEIGWGSGGDESSKAEEWLEEYAQVSKDVSDFVDLPVAPKDEPYNPEDQDMADIVGRILGDDNDWDRLKKAFVWVDSDNDEEFEGYRLQIARLRNEELPEDAAPDEGDLHAYWDLVQAAMESVISGKADIPKDELAAAYEFLAIYYEKFDEEPPPFEEIEEDEEDTVDLEAEEEIQDEEERLFNLALLRALTE